MTTQVSMHNVVSVEFTNYREHNRGDDTGFTTREIIITDEKGDVLEITLFANDKGNDGKRLQFRI